ncbi:alpha/beta hydrolase-fold protein [Flavobacterium sp.]|uniref:alpha/beta hydrolase-fold protein n=1 Tax=Flavobacterium sp. TaxID=239 RepID=UPI00391A4959
MKRILLFSFLFFETLSFAQVTIRVTAVPGNTPANASLYAAGTFNTWNPGSAAHILQPDGLGAYLITIPEGTGTAEYKITRGSWPTVEGNASGGYLPNRTFTFTGSPQTINITVQSWEDIAGSGTGSTAAANVQILSNAFTMPQLNRNRKIWLYLPPDYFTTTKTYPVLYMQDGQNLFDNATSFSGEWQVDETLNTLHAQGNYGAIVVGIENGGALRLNEYSPWNNPSYGGGEGDQYMQFIAETLKPYVDANFRTKPEAQYNALIGSSMGALISTYGAVKYPQYFSKVGSLSPAYWFSMMNMNNYILTTTNALSGLRIYFVCGQNESASMVTDATTIKNNLVTKGVLSSNTLTKFDSYGTHTEAYWRGEFSALYQWLFQEETLDTSAISESQIKVFQINSNEFYVSGLNEEMTLDVYSIHGQKLGKQKIINGNNIVDLELSKGLYIFINDKMNFKLIK